VAGQKVRETVFEAARQQMAASQPDPAELETARQRPCDVGVVFALETESGGLEDLLDRAVTYRGHGFVVRVGGLKGRQVAVLRSGAGREAAAAATEALLAGHHPRWVISAGFAGGLVERLKPNDILVADEVVDTAGNRLALEVQCDRDALRQLPRVHVGRLLTADRVLRRPSEKRSLGEAHAALAVDMETLAVAEVCRQRQTPLLAIRVMIDAVDDALPPDVGHLLKQKTPAARWGAALGAIFNRPGSLKDMLKLKEKALIATDRLAKFLVEVIQAIAPAPESPPAD
jgi:adenosylhomocysteine nucleosidase